MQVQFILDDNENKVTPMGIAESITTDELLSVQEMRELIAYLSIYVKYNAAKG